MPLIRYRAMITASVMILLCTISFGQSGGQFEIARSADQSGGVLAGGVYEVNDAIGQPDASTSSAGSFEIAGGYLTTLDTTPPDSAATVVDATQVGGDITGTYGATDSGSGVAAVALHVKEPGGAWTIAGSVSGGVWAYTPTAGDGAYAFATVATDNLNNAEAAPSGSDSGDVTVLYNEVADSTYEIATVADGAFLFPMTDALDVTITFSGGASGGPIVVSRTTGDVTDGGYNAAALIDEMLSITGSFSGSATITWTFDPASDNTLSGALDTVFQFEGGVPINQYSVTPSGETLTIGPLTSFSDWYAGSNNAGVAEWQVLNH
ncbi:hypothetical protein KQI84_07905 [bacterium]|nr:hypothetical protein [bacterium]